MNELSVTEKDRILRLHERGWSERRIARETHHHRLTVRRYLREAVRAEAHCPPQSATDPAPPNAPEVPAGSASRTRSSCEQFRPFIEAELAKGRNATAICQDLVLHHGYGGSYDAVKRLVRKLHPADEPKISCRFETEPGLESQADYGEGAPTIDPRTGKYRKPRLFVLSLGCSRHAFRKVVWKSSKRIWAELHEEAFEYFGGATATIRLDNLKEGVLDPDVYDPELNPLYAAVLKHYGIVALPCRPYAPDLKGKVESAVGYTQRTALKGKRFESIDAQNVHLFYWNEHCAFTRIHGTTKRQVCRMFEEEKPFLLPLPPTRFEYYDVGQRTVHFDGFIEVHGAYYHAPPRYVGSRVIVHIGRLWVRILDPKTHQLVCEHTVTGKGQRRVVDAYLPKQTPPRILDLVARVAHFGPSCAIFARAVENERGALAARTLFGVLDLAHRYGGEALERACTFAVTAQTLRLRFLRAYLAHHPPPALTSEHKIIPSIDTYAQHFAFLTQGDPHDN
jgi:transposase